MEDRRETRLVGQHGSLWLSRLCTVQREKAHTCSTCQARTGPELNLPRGGGFFSFARRHNELSWLTTHVGWLKI